MHIHPPPWPPKPPLPDPPEPQRRCPDPQAHRWVVGVPHNTIQVPEWPAFPCSLFHSKKPFQRSSSYYTPVAFELGGVVFRRISPMAVCGGVRCGVGFASEKAYRGTAFFRSESHSTPPLQPRLNPSIASAVFSNRPCAISSQHGT